MKPEKARKTEKTAGYIMLIFGIALIVIPALAAFYVFLSQTQIPQFVQTPQGQSDSVAGLIAFSNVCMVFFIFVVVVWAGSIVSSRGITLIKDVKLKLVGKSLREAVEAAKKYEKEET